MHWFKDVGQAEIYTGKPLVPQPSDSDIELAIDKLKSHISPSTDEISAEVFKAGSRKICFEIHKMITSIWKKE